MRQVCAGPVDCRPQTLAEYQGERTPHSAIDCCCYAAFNSRQRTGKAGFYLFSSSLAGTGNTYENGKRSKCKRLHEKSPETAPGAAKGRRALMGTCVILTDLPVNGARAGAMQSGVHHAATNKPHAAPGRRRPAAAPGIH